MSAFRNNNDQAGRRGALRFGIAALLTASPLVRAWADVLSELSSVPMVTIENFSAKGESTGIVRVAKVVLSEAEWVSKLKPDVFRVTRKHEADHPYTGSYWNSRADGIYRCACCETVLFSSKTKFESGSGWPSFWEPISALNINRDKDRFFCSRCDAFAGHVFSDGPTDSGLRFSANSLALDFVAQS